jgi:hypothetical protein
MVRPARLWGGRMISSRRMRTAIGGGMVAAGVLLGIAAVVPAAGASGNEGTIKVTQDSECGGPDNQPKVESPFYTGGFGFTGVEEFTLTFETQPGGSQALSVSGQTEEDGTFCEGPLTLPVGSYKVTYTDPTGNKSKVFSVGVGATTPPTTEPPTTEPPTTEPPTTEPPTTTPPTTSTGGGEDGGEAEAPTTAAGDATGGGDALADTGAGSAGLLALAAALLLGGLVLLAGNRIVGARIH